MNKGQLLKEEEEEEVRNISLRSDVGDVAEVSPHFSVSPCVY